VKEELVLLQKLTDHPHIIEVKELLEDDGYYYIATEVCEGGQLLTNKKFNEK